MSRMGRHSALEPSRFEESRFEDGRVWPPRAVHARRPTWACLERGVERVQLFPQPKSADAGAYNICPHCFCMTSRPSSSNIQHPTSSIKQICGLDKVTGSGVKIIAALGLFFSLSTVPWGTIGASRARPQGDCSKGGALCSVGCLARADLQKHGLVDATRTAGNCTSVHRHLRAQPSPFFCGGGGGQGGGHAMPQPAWLASL